MFEKDEEYQRLVEQKMKARAERNARLRQAEKEAAEQAEQEAKEAKERAEQEKQTRAEREKQRQAEMRVKRKLKWQKFVDNPKGVRNIQALRHICIECGSDRVQDRSSNEPYFQVCQDCHAEWYVNHCWSCGTGLVDSRDPDTPKCRVCGWHKCAVCGACKLDGCSTNPYNKDNRFRDNANANRAARHVQDSLDSTGSTTNV